MILPTISEPSWQLRHVWRLSPRREEVRKVLSELKICLDQGLSNELASKSYLVADELINNAYEHGCLRIGAVKKAELLAQGDFEEFVGKLEVDPLITNQHWIEVEVVFQNAQLTLKVRDSGPGYKVDSLNEKSLDQTRLSQRGLQIIQSISSTFVVETNPSQSIAVIDFSTRPLS